MSLTTRSMSTNKGVMGESDDQVADKATIDMICERLKKLDQLDIISDNLKELNASMKEMKTDISNNTACIQTLQTSIDCTSSKVNVMASDEANKQDAIRRNEMQSIRLEQQSKKYNMILGNIKEKKNPNSRYQGETREQSIAIVKNVLTNVLKICDANEIIIADAHRLPGKTPGRRNLIFKVTQMSHKQLIWDKLSVLSTYNSYQAPEEKVYIDMNQLPAKLVRDKISLKPRHKNLKDEKKEPKWYYDKKTVEYCIRVGETIYRPVDNFDYKKSAIADGFESPLPPITF